MAGTVNGMLNNVSEWYPDKDALVQAFEGPDRRYTFSEANATARRTANELLARGVEKEDRIGMVTDTIVEHLITRYAAYKIGAIPVPLHVRATPTEMAATLDDVEAEALFFEHPAYTEDVRAIRGTVDSISEYVAYSLEGDPPDFAESFSSFGCDAEAVEPDVDVRPEDPAIIMLTSGTTGKPKPVVHTHEDLEQSALHELYTQNVSTSDVNLNGLSTGFSGYYFQSTPYFSMGATVVHLESFDPVRIPELIEQEDISNMVLVPTQFKQILNEVDIADYDLSSLKQIGWGGESLGPELYERLQEEFTEDVFTLYAGTEGLWATALTPDDVTADRLESVGKPVPMKELRIIEQDSRDPEARVEPGEAGEVILRGPGVADEIWDDPERTASVFHEDGWWFTGDLGRVDQDDFLYIEGRVDNVIMSGGVKISAEKVDASVEAHPDVVECAVVGVEDEEWGQAVKAYVVSSSADLDADDLEEWCLDHDELSDYQRPREYEFRDELPRTNTGKLDRSALRD